MGLVQARGIVAHTATAITIGHLAAYLWG